MSTLDLSAGGLARRATTERAPLVCGTVAGPLFTLVWIIESATRTGYNPLRHPVSTLELGDLGWTQVANFIVAGVLSAAFAVGLSRALRPLGGSTWGPLLVGAFAVGLIGAGLFATDPVSGYPPGTPDMQAGYSVHGALHDLLSVFSFAGLPAACFVFARRFAGWHELGWSIYSAATGVVFSIAFVLASMSFSQVPSLVAYGGLFQRLTITVGWTWLALLAVYLLRRSSEPENTTSAGPG